MSFLAELPRLQHKGAVAEEQRRRKGHRSFPPCPGLCTLAGPLMATSAMSPSTAAWHLKQSPSGLWSCRLMCWPRAYASDIGSLGPRSQRKMHRVALLAALPVVLLSPVAAHLSRRQLSDCSRQGSGSKGNRQRAALQRALLRNKLMRQQSGFPSLWFCLTTTASCSGYSWNWPQEQVSWRCQRAYSFCLRVSFPGSACANCVVGVVPRAPSAPPPPDSGKQPFNISKPIAKNVDLSSVSCCSAVDCERCITALLHLSPRDSRLN